MASIGALDGPGAKFEGLKGLPNDRPQRPSYGTKLGTTKSSKEQGLTRGLAPNPNPRISISINMSVSMSTSININMIHYSYGPPMNFLIAFFPRRVLHRGRRSLGAPRID